MKPKIALIYIDSGGGHRAAATALCDVIRKQGREWELEMVCLQDLLDPIDFIRKFTGIPFQDVYNIMLRHGWTLGSAQLIPLMHLVIRLSHPAVVEVLRRHWSHSRPDLAVSLVPHYNRALKEALDDAWPGTPYTTVLTDIADFPPHFWIERQDQYVICGSDRAIQQAAELGLPTSRILRASGMILHPKFHVPLRLDRRAERIRLGLQPHLPTALVLFGGEGSLEMVRIAQALNRADSGVQLILLCGKHQKAALALREMTRNIPLFVEGFTKDVPFYMELADFLIGKPGPGSISEALAKGLPVIVQRNAWTLAQERYNADWIEKEELGVVLRSFDQILDAVRTMLAPENYQHFRQRVARTRNFAVYEIPDLLAEILARRDPQRNNRVRTFRSESSVVTRAGADQT